MNYRELNHDAYNQRKHPLICADETDLFRRSSPLNLVVFRLIVVDGATVKIAINKQETV